MPPPSLIPRFRALALATVGALSLIAPLAAQTDIWNPALAAIPVVQTVTLGPEIVFVQSPPVGWNLVRVLPGSTVHLELGSDFAAATDVVWRCDGREIAQTGSETHLDLVNFRPAFHSDGEYQATFTLAGEPRRSGVKRLVGTDFRNGPLLNISSRAHLSTASPEITSGFVIGSEGIASTGRYVLVRVAGPSLAAYGVTQPAPDPTLTLIDLATGHEVTPAFPAVVYPDGSTPESRYYDLIRRASVALGAFPIQLPTREQPTAPESALLVRLKAGAYTATVRSASQTSGDVLLEVYEVSDPLIESLTEPVIFP